MRVCYEVGQNLIKLAPAKLKKFTKETLQTECLCWLLVSRLTANQTHSSDLLGMELFLVHIAAISLTGDENEDVM